ncbi:MAG: aldo/keto reductase [Pseudomonadota bacterium]
MTALPTNTLTTKSGRSLTFTAIGTGTAPLGNLYFGIDEAAADETLSVAYDAGSRYFDTAPLYGFGLSERRLGHFLRQKRPENTLVSTKAGRLLKVGPRDPSMQPAQWFDVPSREIVFDYSYDGFMRSFEFSLERLGVDRVDILYCHDIDVFTHGERDIAMARTKEFLDGGHKAMVELRDQGMIDAFGLGVNEWEVCQFVAERAEVDLFLLAGRYTLLEQEALNTFLPLCEDNGLGVIIGGPYNSGILATGPVEGAYYNYVPAPPEIMDKTAKIKAVCDRYGVTLRDAALQFPTFHPAVVSIIPGATSRQEIEGTMESFKTPIPEELWAALKEDGLLRIEAPVPGA